MLSPHLYRHLHFSIVLPLLCILCLCFSFCAPDSRSLTPPDIPADFRKSPRMLFSKFPISKKPKFAAAGLIDIAEVDPTIIIDLQYKRPSSIAKSPLYPSNFPALLRPETALRLKYANSIVKKFGLRIKLWDAYRPPSAQWKLFQASGRNDRYVANPNNAPSQHSCGTAVDITLVQPDGSPVPMPTGFDAITPQASSTYRHSDPAIAKNLEILQYAMHKAGFFPLPREWWHHIDIHYKNYPDTIPLKRIQ